MYQLINAFIPISGQPIIADWTLDVPLDINAFMETCEKDLEGTLKDFIDSRVEVNRKESDCRFMDSYDHLMTLLVNQTESDMEVGIRTPFKIRLEEQEGQISNNWYKD